jgi:hypothetical protein
LKWDDKAGQLTADGDKAVSRSARELLQVVRGR